MYLQKTFRTRFIRLLTVPRPLAPFRLPQRFASGYGDPSDEAHPATANPQDQGSSTQRKQPEHPGPRENEPSRQGGSSFGDKGQNPKVDAPPTDTESPTRASETSWDGNGSPGGSRVHGSEKQETKLGGSLSGNRDKSTDPPAESGVGGKRVKGDLRTEGQTDGKDARDVGGKDDSRKQN
jgi:hypothetical protein